MIGGTVIKTNGDYDNIEIVVKGTGCEENDILAIKVEVSSKSRSISEGDAVWWQGRKAYWTPKNHKGEWIKEASDIEIPRIGYSYTPKA